MSPDLRTLQRALQAHLLNGDAAVAGWVRPGGMGVERRIAIYHHAYRQRLLAALRDTFGHTLRYMGDQWFDAAALHHIERNPSWHASLRDYGADFERTLASLHPDMGELPELACLDRTLRHAFDGADAMPLALSELAAVKPEQWGHLGFVFHPTVSRHQLQHNTLAIWQALDDEQDAPPALPLARPGELLVWRRGEKPHFRSLQALEAAALDELIKGAPFAETAQRLAAASDDPNSTAALGALLRRWIDDELLVAIQL
jgi:hypothetical protein